MGDVDFITLEQLRELADFDGDGYLVASLYLDVDGRKYPRKTEYEKNLASMMRAAKRDLKARPTTREKAAATERDLAMISEHATGKFRRRSSKSLAVFACSEKGFFHAYALPHSLRDRVVLNHSPYIRPLNALLSEYRRYGVIVANRKTARIFVFYMGRLVEAEVDVVDDVHGRHEQGGWSQARFSRHIEAEVARHLKRTAQEADRILTDAGVERIILAGQKDLLADLEKALLPSLRELVVSTVALKQSAGPDDVRKMAEVEEARIEQIDDALLIERLRSGVGTGTAVSGLDDTLRALGLRKVEGLVVSRGFTAAGWKCTACGRLAAIGPDCPECSAAMRKVDDVVEDAVEEAVAQGFGAELVAGSSDLDVMGRVGAILRY